MRKPKLQNKKVEAAVRLQADNIALELADELLKDTKSPEELTLMCITTELVAVELAGNMAVNTILNNFATKEEYIKWFTEELSKAISTKLESGQFKPMYGDIKNATTAN